MAGTTITLPAASLDERSFDAPFPSSSKRAPHRRIGRKGLHAAPGHVDESAVVGDRAMPKQSCQQRQRMVGERRIYERLLPFQRFHGAAAWQPVVVERWLDQFREQFGDSSQTGSRALVLPIPGLTKHKLPPRRVVSQVEPV